MLSYFNAYEHDSKVIWHVIERDEKFEELLRKLSADVEL